jgi:hypothetical protein
MGTRDRGATQGTQGNTGRTGEGVIIREGEVGADVEGSGQEKRYCCRFDGFGWKEFWEVDYGDTMSILDKRKSEHLWRFDAEV